MASFSADGTREYGKRKQILNGNGYETNENFNSSKVPKKQNLNASIIDKGFEKALKELGVRKQCAIIPNLNAQRTRNTQSARISENSTTSTDKQEDPNGENADDSTQSAMMEFDNEEKGNDVSAKSISKENGDNWVEPRKNIKADTVNKILNPKQQELNLQNRFSPLNNQDTHNDNINANSDTISKSTNQAKNLKAPPIYCRHNSSKELITLIANVTDKSNFYLKDCKPHEQTIISKDIDTFKLIKEKLVSANAPFYTYTPPGEKNKLLILKGINEDFTAEDVKSEIVNLNIPNIQVIKVEKLRVKDNNVQKNILLIQLSSDSILKNITKINHLLNLKIKWEPYRKHKIYQCHKCQRVGHSSINCNLGFRCVKCMNEHEPGKCTRTKDTQDDLPYCVNCKEKGHTANYRGCKYLRYAQAFVNAVKKTTPITQQKRNVLRPNFSYADATYAQGNNNPVNLSTQTPINSKSSSMDVTHHLLTKSIESLFANFKVEIINIINNLNAAIQKQINSNNEKNQNHI